MPSTIPHRVSFLCNPLLDISAAVEESFLKPFGLAVGEAGLAKESQLGIFEALEQREGVVYIPGGAGLNSARVCQWLSDAPGTASYIGCIGTDRYGTVLREAAERDGVEMVVEVTDKAPTGTCAVAVVGKERTLLANLAAANMLTADHVNGEAVHAAWHRAQIIYATGFALILSADNVIRAAEAAHETGKEGGLMCFNLSAPYIVDLFTEGLMKVLPHVNYIFGNENEAIALSKLMKWDEECGEDIQKIANKAAADLPCEHQGERVVIFTQGPNPTVFASRSAGPQLPVPSRVVPQEKVIDTNGAGDAFLGGFLAGLSRGLDMVKCIELGSYAASIIIQHDGCTFPAKPDEHCPVHVA